MSEKLVKLITKRNIYDNNKVINVYSSIKDAAEDNDTSSQNVSQSIKKKCNCKKYRFEYISIPQSVLIEAINNSHLI